MPTLSDLQLPKGKYNIFNQMSQYFYVYFLECILSLLPIDISYKSVSIQLQYYLFNEVFHYAFILG